MLVRSIMFLKSHAKRIGFPQFQDEVLRNKVTKSLSPTQEKALRIIYTTSQQHGMPLSGALQIAKAFVNNALAMGSKKKQKVRSAVSRTTSPVARTGAAKKSRSRAAHVTREAARKKLSVAEQQHMQLKKKFHKRLMSITKLDGLAFEQKVSTIWKLLEKRNVELDERLKLAVRLLRPNALKQCSRASLRLTSGPHFSSKGKAGQPVLTAAQEYNRFCKEALRKSGVTKSPKSIRTLAQLWRAMRNREVEFSRKVSVAVQALKLAKIKEARSSSQRASSKPKTAKVGSPEGIVVRTLLPPREAKIPKSKTPFLIFYRAMLMTGRIAKEPKRRHNMIRFLWDNTRHLKRVSRRINLATAHLDGLVKLPLTSSQLGGKPGLARGKAKQERVVKQKKQKKEPKQFNEKQRQFIDFYRAMVVTGKVSSARNERSKMIKFLWKYTKHLPTLESRIQLGKEYLEGGEKTSSLPAPFVVDMGTLQPHEEEDNQSGLGKN